MLLSIDTNKKWHLITYMGGAKLITDFSNWSVGVGTLVGIIMWKEKNPTFFNNMNWTIWFLFNKNALFSLISKFHIKLRFFFRFSTFDRTSESLPWIGFPILSRLIFITDATTIERLFVLNKCCTCVQFTFVVLCNIKWYGWFKK